ncbi:MAG TPA: hypothetical protein VFL83_09380 [Anaeromyxobacter sp.]|nr:hypothetical protein [Anaeromyxobacter sp.]
MVNSPTLATAFRAAAAAAAAAVAESSPSAAKVRTSARAPVVAGAPGEIPAHLERTAVAIAHAAARLRTRARAGVRGYQSASKASSPKTSSSKTSSSKTSSTSSSSALSFLSDPKLSIEEKLIRLIAYLDDKYQKEIQAKMDQINGKAPEATSSSAKRKGGIVGAIGAAVSSVAGGDAAKAISGLLKVPGAKAFLGQTAGPVLALAASALGFPAAAPLLLKYGSKVVDVAAAMSAAPSSGSTGSSGTSTKSASGTRPDEKLVMMEIQRLVDKQREMFGLVSNILRAGHDTRMATISNIR